MLSDVNSGIIFLISPLKYTFCPSLELAHGDSSNEGSLHKFEHDKLSSESHPLM